MSYEEKMRPAQKPHTIILEERARLSISGVEDVDSFDEGEVSVLTSQGLLIVRGSGLHVGRLSLDTGELSLEGLVTDLVYEETQPTGSLWSRLFK